MKYQKEKLRKKWHILQQQQNNKVPRNKLNPGGKRPVLRKLQDIEEIVKIQTGIYGIHGLEELTSLKCPFYPKQSIDVTQFLLKYQWHI